MLGKRFRLLALLTTLVVLAVVACASITLWRLFHRPLFYGTFACHVERGVFLPEWWPFPFPTVDQAGNLVLLDEPTNLLVVVPTGNPQYQGQRAPRSTSAGVILELTTQPPRTVSLPTAPDHLFICDRDGKVILETVIPGGTARELFECIDTDTPDATTVLSKKVLELERSK